MLKKLCILAVFRQNISINRRVLSSIFESKLQALAIYQNEKIIRIWSPKQSGGPQFYINVKKLTSFFALVSFLSFLRSLAFDQVSRPSFPV